MKEAEKERSFFVVSWKRKGGRKKRYSILEISEPKDPDDGLLNEWNLGFAPSKTLFEGKFGTFSEASLCLESLGIVPEELPRPNWTRTLETIDLSFLGKTIVRCVL